MSNCGSIYLSISVVQVWTDICVFQGGEESNRIFMVSARRAKKRAKGEHMIYEEGKRKEEGNISWLEGEGRLLSTVAGEQVQKEMGSVMFDWHVFICGLRTYILCNLVGGWTYLQA